MADSDTIVQKSKGGRKPHAPTAQQRAEVAALASFGIPQVEIAKYIGVDKKTLNVYYRDEIEHSMITLKTRALNFLARGATGMALKDDVGATYSDCARQNMFYLKTQMGFRETDNLNHTSEDGSMTPTRIVIEAAPVNGKD